MIKGKLKFLCLSVLVFSAFEMSAQNAVKLISTDGTETIFLLSSHPKITLEPTGISLRTDSETITYQGYGIKAEFTDYEPNSVEQIEISTPLFKVGSNTIEAYNLSVGEIVCLFDLGGVLMKSFKADNSGSIVIPTDDLASGCYIVNSKIKSFKYFKK